MIFYSEKNVYEAAKERIKGIFERHKDVPIVVSFSGGKDSTVVLNVTKEVMDELGIKKIPVFWLDQEIESPHVVEYMHKIQKLPWVDLYWVQSEFPKYNAHLGKWDNCWPKDGTPMREKEPNNPYVDFDLADYKKYSTEYGFFLHKIFGDYVTIGGLHIDESTTRRTSLLKKVNDVSSCPFTGDLGGGIYYPLFDWSVKDIWCYIFRNRLDYCKLYNYMFAFMPLEKCRVGSFWHEQSHTAIKLMKEISPYFYDKVANRLGGVSTTNQTYELLISFIKGLPPYFQTWQEYVEYLIENIMPMEFREKMIKRYNQSRNRFLPLVESEDKKSYVEERLGHAAAVCVVKMDHGMRHLANVDFILNKEVSCKLKNK